MFFERCALTWLPLHNTIGRLATEASTPSGLLNTSHAYLNFVGLPNRLRPPVMRTLTTFPYWANVLRKCSAAVADEQSTIVDSLAAVVHIHRWQRLRLLLCPCGCACGWCCAPVAVARCTRPRRTTVAR